MRTKTLVALYFWILDFDDVTCIRSIKTDFKNYLHSIIYIKRKKYEYNKLNDYNYFKLRYFAALQHRDELINT